MHCYTHFHLPLECEEAEELVLIDNFNLAHLLPHHKVVRNVLEEFL